MGNITLAQVWQFLVPLLGGGSFGAIIVAYLGYRAGHAKPEVSDWPNERFSLERLVLTIDQLINEIRQHGDELHDLVGAVESFNKVCRNRGDQR